MTRKPDDWMPFFIGDYLADTMHLSTEGHGAYLLLIMTYWSLGGSLPSSDRKLRAIVKATPSAWKRLKPTMQELFRIDGETWRHDALDNVRNRFFNGRMPNEDWNALRQIIFKRDDYTCAYCGKRGGHLTVDHIFPFSRGGDYRYENLATACFPCNRAKGARTPEEWRRAT